MHVLELIVIYYIQPCLISLNMYEHLWKWKALTKQL